MKYNYYPGCSLERNASAYHDSAMAVGSKLGIEFVEVEDWNCCGATEAISIEKIPAYALSGRNLALTYDQKENGELVAPCSLCLLNLHKCDYDMAKSPKLTEQVNTALEAGGLSYEPGTVEAKHLLDVFVKDIKEEQIQEKVEKFLYGLKIAPYYGCLSSRPGFDGRTNFDFPMRLDKLLSLLGADIVDYSLKTDCCGGHMTQISEETSLELIRRLLKNAEDEGADMIVTICPMCQFNLDAYQDSVNKFFKTDFNIPVLYFTQVMGLAFGLTEKELGIGKEFISAKEALSKILSEPPKKPKEKRKSKTALPMPGI